MIHFAYPNVKLSQRRFIGCGRYVAAEESPGDEYKAVTPKMVQKETELRVAASILAPASSYTGNKVWQKKG